MIYLLTKLVRTSAQQKDLDVVLVVEALTKSSGSDFGSSFVKEDISIGPGAMENRNFIVLKNRKIKNSPK